jgi:hypothetical protein
MPDKKFELGDYVEVKDRIKLFYELFGQGRLVTGEVRLTNEPDGVPRVLVQAFAYRDPDDQLPGVGWSWLELPGKTPYTRGSEVENAETSAWGRAIASLGILVDRSIASAQEVENKREPMTPASVNAQERERLASYGENIPGKPESRDLPQFAPDGGLIGTVTTEGTKDGQLRETPNGWALPFKVKNGRKAYIVIAEDKMAQALATLWPTIVNQRVTVWGHWSEETIPAKGTKPEIRYKLLHLERIQTPDGLLPAPIEAETAALFDANELEVINAAVDRVGAA